MSASLSPEVAAFIASLRATIAALEAQVEALKSTLVNYAAENEILKRRLYGTKSERGGTSELQLLLGNLLEQQAGLQKQLDELTKGNDDESPPPPPPPPPPPAKDAPKPKGRRDLSESKLPRVVLTFEDASLGGKIIGYDESYQLMYFRGRFQVLVKRTAKYELEVNGQRTVLGVVAPRTLFPRTMLHTSALAWIAVQKFGLGVPHHRLEQHLTDSGMSLDRSVMSRGMEEVGSTLGATIVAAMMQDAITNCGVLSTDATGGAIQPGPRNGGPKRACRKGHFFTIVADADHVLFAYTEAHTSAFVAKLFAGFSGYLQSDASSVYDILERGPPDRDDEKVELVGCWAHLRRYFFEAAICKYRIGVEGMTRIGAIYTADMALSELPPSDRHRARQTKVAPLIDEFFKWVAATREPGRTLATSALGYAKNQETELRRVLDDGRIPLDNTRSERALRRIVVGRKSWLFYGSDLHADAAAAIFSLVASCRLHRVDPERYLDEVMRVLPYWPKDRYLELSPRDWTATRARLIEVELELPLCEITVPEKRTAAHAAS